MKPMLAALAALVMLAPAGAAPPRQDDDSIFIDEVKKEFLEKIAKFVAAKDWKSVFDNYTVAMTKYRTKLVRPDPSAATWCSVVEHLNRELARLPADAFQWYRFEYDGKAEAAWRKAVAERDRAALERVVDEFFFATITEQILDTLGNQYLEERRPREAVHFWRKLLELYPDGRIPRAVTAGRIAVAARAWGNERALADLRRFVEARKIDGPLVAGGEKTTLSAWLRKVEIPRAAAAQGIGKLPNIPEAESRFDRKLIGVRNEVRRWSWDFAEAAPQPRVRRPRGFEPQPAVARPEFPFHPTYAKVGGRELVFFTNGQRVMAMNPGRATLDQPDKCVLWQFPENGKPAIKRAAPDSNFASYVWYTLPNFGVSVEGSHAFATLYSEKKLPEGGPQNQDIFQGPCRLIAFDAAKGRTIWDTDAETVHALFRKLDFYDRNWSFSGPPLVKGDRLYVGVNTSPIGEAESRVLCLDRASGRPLWVSFLGSVPNRNNPMFGAGGRFITYLTVVAEDGGVIYAHTNVGIVAALHGVTGNILWLTKYPRAAGQRDDQWGRGIVAPEIRPANPMHVHKGRLYVLPQDQWEWQVFDMTGGERLTVQTPKKSDGTEITWRNVHQLLGSVEDWLVLGGGESYVVNMVDRYNERNELRTPAGRAYALPRSNVSRCGRGLLTGETLYLPTCGEGAEANGALSIYHGVGSWKNLDQPRWKEANEYGNLIVAGDYLVVATQTKLIVYTDEATIDREFAQRLSQSPPNPAAFLEHGDIMRKNDRLPRAAESYLAFVRAAEGDPRWDSKAREVRTELHTVFMKLGDEAFVSSDPKMQEAAVEHFTMAQGFAYDAGTKADATRRLAETLEKLAGANATIRAQQLDKSIAEAKEARAKAAGELAAVRRKIEGGDATPDAAAKAKELEETVKLLDERMAKEAAERDAARALGREFAKKAVGEYQKIIEKGRDGFHKPDGSDLIQKMYAYAGDRIRDLKKTFGEEVYAPIEKAAADALEKAKTSDEYRRVVEMYGESQAALEAYRRMLEDFKAQEKWEKVLSTLREMKDKYPKEFKVELQKRLNDALEKLRDWRRLSLELRQMAAQFGDEKIAIDGQEIAVREHVEKRQAELRDRLAVAAHVLRDPLKRVADFEAIQTAGAPLQLPMGYLLLEPHGPVPPGIDDDHEFFARGSSVELWNVREKKRVWAAPHPGGWLGTSYQDIRAGAESGVAITAIVPESPADKAGLQAGDVVLQAGGRAARMETFDDLIQEAGAGATVRLMVRRAAATKDVDAVLAAWPATSRPAIVGAAFTREYRLAVVWEDGAASFDVATGQPGWTYRGVRDRFVVQKICATDGRVFLHEHFRADRTRSPFRQLSPQMQQERGILADDEAQSRVICLDDATGEARWARGFPFDPGSAQNHAIEMTGDYFGDAVAVFNRTYRGNVASLELQMLDAPDGKLRRRIGLGNSVLATACDAERGIFYFVEPSNMRTLRGVRLWGPDVDKPVIDVQLQGKVLDPSSALCGIDVRGDWIAVTAPPAQAGRQPQAAFPGKVGIFSAKTGKEHAIVELPAGHSLPANRTGLVALGPDNVLYVYTVPSAKQTPPAGERRAFLSAYKLGEGDEKCVRLWESVAPYVAPGTGFPARIVPVDNSAIFYAQRAAPPRDSNEKPLAAIYGCSQGGYLRTVVSDVALYNDAFGVPANPIAVRRGRVYLQTARGLEVYGN